MFFYMYTNFSYSCPHNNCFAQTLPVLIYYYLVSPFVSDFEEPFNTTTNEFALGVGEAFVISWNPTDMTEGLVSVNDITVSVAMVSVS